MFMILEHINVYKIFVVKLFHCTVLLTTQLLHILKSNYFQHNIGFVFLPYHWALGLKNEALGDLQNIILRLDKNTGVNPKTNFSCLEQHNLNIFQNLVSPDHGIYSMLGQPTFKC